MIPQEWLNENFWYFFVTIIPVCVLIIAWLAAKGAEPFWAVAGGVNPFTVGFLVMTASFPVIVFGSSFFLAALYFMAHFIRKRYGVQQ